MVTPMVRQTATSQMRLQSGRPGSGAYLTTQAQSRIPPAKSGTQLRQSRIQEGPQAQPRPVQCPAARQIQPPLGSRITVPKPIASQMRQSTPLADRAARYPVNRVSSGMVRNVPSRQKTTTGNFF